MKWLRSCGCALLLAIILIILTLSVTLWVFSRRYHSGMASLRAQGEPLTLADMEKGPIPDKENAAIIYQAVFSDLQSPRYAASAEIVDGFSLRAAGRDPSRWAGLAGAVRTLSPLYRDIEHAAAMQKCRFPQDWSGMAPHIAPQWAGVRRLVRICGARAVLSARRGDMGDAARMIGVQFRISESLYDEPLLIGFLVRCAAGEVASQTLRDVSAYGRVSESDADELYRLLSRADPHKGYARILRGERAFYLAARDSMAAYASGGNPAGNTIGGILMYPDRAAYLNAMREEIGRASMSYREAKLKGLFLTAKPLPAYAFSASIMVPVYARARCERDRLIAEIRGSQAFLAALAYRDRYGAYPQSLAEAQSKLGWKLKDDPFSGKPFVYKRKGGGFLLYSIGQDLVDNGGIRGRSSREPDIVWEMAK